MTAVGLASSFPYASRRTGSPSFRRSTVEHRNALEYLDLVAAMALVLCRHNDAEEAVIGGIRVSAGQAAVVPLRVHVDAAGTYRDVLNSARSAIDRANLEAPSEIGSETSVACVVVALHEANIGPDQIGPHHLTQLRHPLTWADVNVVADRVNGVLGCDVALDRLEERTGRWIADQIVAAATQGRADPDRRVRDLDLVGEDERAALLALATTNIEPSQRCVHELIRESAHAHPAHVAVVCEGRQLTYGDLDRQANLLAFRLRDLGVVRGDRVGIRIDRSRELIVAILGVLKAGAAYVPIDPYLPHARQEQIAGLGQLRVLLTGGETPPLPGLPPTLPVDLASEGADEGPDVLSHPDDTAYILFTSGSTGEPKGVAVSHANVVRLFGTTRGLFAFNFDDCWLNSASFTFDASVWEIFGALIHGARVLVASRSEVRDPTLLAAMVRNERVSILTISPTAFEGFRDAALERDDELPALRYVILCAEALNPASLAPWLERWGDESPALVNMYGITETTVHSTFYRLGWADVRDPRSKIGRGLPDTPVYVLDSQGRLAPFGVPGEIYVGGPGVSQGYLAIPEDRENPFLPDSYATVPDGRVYRSGDAGRWLPDGSIEYLGRIDHQVKIRGYRVELGEVEAALLRYPGIRAARAWVLRRAGRPPLLAAAVVLARGAEHDPAKIRESVGRRLPDYMVPAGVVIVDELPRTANGKLDVANLPDPLASRSFTGSEEPASAAVLRVAEDMASVLGRLVDCDDNFFERGGDSITAVRLVAQLRSRGLEADLAQIYEHQTPRAIAEKIESGRAEIRPAPEPFAQVHETDRLLLPRDAVDAYPMTRLQRGMSLHSVLDGEHVYHDILSYRLEGEIDEALFREAVRSAVETNPILRTSFLIDGPTEPLQIVHREAVLACEFIDLRGNSSDQQATMLEEWAQTERTIPFVWTTPGLVRIFGHRTGDREWVVSLSVHHVILDGWSAATLVTEVLNAYAGACHGGRPAQKRETRAMSSYVALERVEEASPDHRTFWLEYLDDAKPTELPAFDGHGHGHKAVAQLELVIPHETSSRILELAREAGMPAKTVYLAAHTALMAFASGNPEIVTGLITSGRIEETGGDEALGLFLNTVPVRATVADQTWHELLRETYQNESAIYRHRRYPFERIQAESTASKLCPTAFNYTDFHIYDQLDSAGLRLRDVRYREQTDFLFLVQVHRHPADGRMLLSLAYRTDLYRLEQIEFYKRAYARLLYHAATEPDGRVTRSLTEWARRERQTASVLEGTAVEVPAVTLPESFAAQVARTPDAPALRAGAAVISYGKLNARANKLAHRLTGMGVGPEAAVAVLMERSVDLVTALLAVVKAGGYFVPLPPGDPAERLSWIMGEVHATVLLTDAALAGQRFDHDAVTLTIDSAALNEFPHTDPPVRVRPDNLVYVMYTSGSTGIPKGVAITHRDVADFAADRRWRNGPHERVLLHSPHSFDASTYELWVPLLNGGTAIVMPPGDVNAAGLRKVITDQHVTALWLTAALFDLVTDEDPSCLAGARQVLSGGDVVPPGAVKRALAACPGLAVRNGYGPTETTTFAATHLVRSAAELGSTVPIGEPLDNMRAYVLDQYLAPVPVGVTGELYVAGTGLARGYLGRPGMTAERFVACPYGPGRMYRTGDLVRPNPDGTLIFAGRADDQVKMSGFRIELGEVEAALAAHSGVTQSAVVVRETQPGHKHLVGYVVGEAEPAELRQWVASRLPEYMVPAAVMVIDELPLTANGKVDRTALPAPDFPPREAGRLPRNAREELLCQLFEEVLGVSQVTIDDDYFALGGRSLLATKLASRARSALNVDISAREVFAGGTVAGIIELLDVATKAKARPKLRRMTKDRGTS